MVYRLASGGHDWPPTPAASLRLGLWAPNPWQTWWRQAVTDVVSLRSRAEPQQCCPVFCSDVTGRAEGALGRCQGAMSRRSVRAGAAAREVQIPGETCRWGLTPTNETTYDGVPWFSCRMGHIFEPMRRYAPPQHKTTTGLRGRQPQVAFPFSAIETWRCVIITGCQTVWHSAHKLSRSHPAAHHRCPPANAERQVPSHGRALQPP